MAEAAQKKIVFTWSKEKDAELRQKLRSIHEHANDVAIAEAAAIAAAPESLTAGDTSAKGQGIYIGLYSPKDRDGKNLGKTFNVFAAPQDLTDAAGDKVTLTYEDTVRRISELKNWNGFDGSAYTNDTEIYKALEDGSYSGSWIIPTFEVLVGTDVNGNKNVQEDNLYAHKDKGDLAGTFCIAAASGSGYPYWYWSSTEDRDDSSFVVNVRFSDGDEHWDDKVNFRLSCRPVRLVAASAAPSSR